WRTDGLFHQVDHAEPRWVAGAVIDVARAALGDTYAGWRDAEPVLVESWVVAGGRGAWHVAHNHFPRTWSGVLYVSAEECVAKDDPSDRGGKIEFLSPIAAAQAFCSPSSVTYDPRDGLLLLFPGALQHLVHP